MVSRGPPLGSLNGADPTARCRERRIKMKEHGTDVNRERPTWVSCSPGCLSGRDRRRHLRRRFAFPAALLILGLGIGGALYWGESLFRVDRPAPYAEGISSGANQFTDGSGRPAPLESRLTVRSTPSGAVVRMNGDSLGLTPLADRALTAGTYLLSLRLDGYFRSDTVVVLNDLGPARVGLTLRPRPGFGASPVEAPPPTDAQTRAPQRAVPRTAVRAASVPPEPPVATHVGGIYVTSVPEGARLTVNGAERGRTPLSLANLPIGTSRIALSMSGYKQWAKQVDIRMGTTRRVHAELVPVSRHDR